MSSNEAHPLKVSFSIKNVSLLGMYTCFNDTQHAKQDGGKYPTNGGICISLSDVQPINVCSSPKSEISLCSFISSKFSAPLNAQLPSCLVSVATTYFVNSFLGRVFKQYTVFS